MRQLTLILRNPVFWVLGLYLFFCYLMLQITLQYIPYDTDVAFLRIKQDYTGYAHYRIAFFVHVYTSMLVLLAGFTQFSARLRKKWPTAHKNLGRLYIVVVLVFSAPSGLVLGVYANGGWSAQVAFCLLALMWFYFTLRAMQAIRQQNYTAHQRWMWRSFALALSAITLRLWKYGLVWAFQPRPMDVYRWVAWLGWTLNLIAIELYIIYRKQS